MYARLVVGFIQPGRLDEAVQLWQDSVLPSVQQQAGFKGVRLMVDRKNNRIVSLGLWETEAHFQATIAWNEAQVARFAELFAAPPAVGGYEVVVSVDHKV
jgi:heme-degrading monooxygenase HmoA